MSWQRQTLDTPLFPDILWSRPENKSNAGRLLLIGGHAYNFAHIAKTYSQASLAGAGSMRVIVPETLKKSIGSYLEDIQFAPSNNSGSFAEKALPMLVDNSLWAEMVVIPGDLGRNSETTIVLEKLLSKSTLPMVLAKDAVDSFRETPLLLFDRPNTVLVIDYTDLQKLAINCGYSPAFTSDLPLPTIIDYLQKFIMAHKAQLIIKHLDTIIVVTNEGIVSTRLKADVESWRTDTAAYASVYLMQHSTKPLEALSTAIHELYKSH